ncbi:hypothetical protein BDM02DRAFT_3193194 [Thelephora ganbajun]|uniref:Uncharacterized protein n=1 Tax=Thelephora ganbajun TaxID=370292 RepID=A0ACB6YYX5_THEGA|nr:hypothetical protein BDM02DRAFT_3193194 [Thelephora ganbajun]
MEGTKKSEKSEKEPPPLQIYPKCSQNAPPTHQCIKTDDPHLGFYTVYKKEVTDYDTVYVKKCDDDLNTTLIFARPPSFTLPKLKSDPNRQSAALLRAILLTLNRTAILGETPVAPPIREHPSNEIVTITCLMYTSLLIFLLATFVAMLGKQRWYMWNSGGSMTGHYRDRQCKFDGLKTWRLDFFIESSGDAPNRSSPPAVFVGVLLYVGIIIAGVSSYGCPFQTPGPDVLRSLWTKAGPHLSSPCATWERLRSITFTAL